MIQVPYFSINLGGSIARILRLRVKRYLKETVLYKIEYESVKLWGCKQIVTVYELAQWLAYFTNKRESLIIKNKFIMARR